MTESYTVRFEITNMLFGKEILLHILGWACEHSCDYNVNYEGLCIGSAAPFESPDHYYKPPKLSKMSTEFLDAAITYLLKQKGGAISLGRKDYHGTYPMLVIIRHISHNTIRISIVVSWGLASQPEDRMFNIQNFAKELMKELQDRGYSCSNYQELEPKDE